MGVVVPGGNDGGNGMMKKILGEELLGKLEGNKLGWRRVEPQNPLGTDGPRVRDGKTETQNKIRTRKKRLIKRWCFGRCFG